MLRHVTLWRYRVLLKIIYVFDILIHTFVRHLSKDLLQLVILGKSTNPLAFNSLALSQRSLDNVMPSGHLHTLFHWWMGLALCAFMSRWWATHYVTSCVCTEALPESCSFIAFVHQVEHVNYFPSEELAEPVVRTRMQTEKTDTVV